MKRCRQEKSEPRLLLVWLTLLFAVFGVRTGFALDPIKDSTKPGEKITFWWTDGPNPNVDKVRGFRFRFRTESGDFSPWASVLAGQFSDTNNYGERAIYEFLPLDGDAERVKDWHQEIVHADGTSSVWNVNIKKESPWTMHPLNDLPSMLWRIPDLAPITGGNPALTIYTAINMDLYLRHNPLGFLGGDWSAGQSLNDLGISIEDGVVTGLQGIYWSQSEFVFDPDPAGFGFTPSGGMADLLDSATFAEEIGIIAEHNHIPEPSTAFLFGAGVAAIFIHAYRWRTRKNTNTPLLEQMRSRFQATD